MTYEKVKEMNCAKCIHYVVCPYDNVMSKAELITNCIHFIDTADVKPVVHGKWIWDDFLLRCSVCGVMQDYRYNFCPNCGANMRGEHNE